MKISRYKYLLLMIFVAVISSAAYAGKGDDTAPPSVERTPAALKPSSYFQGTWFGSWQSESRDGTGREVTITVGMKNPDESFDIEYSWGSGKDIKGRHIISGTVKAKGREDGEKLVFEYDDPLSLKVNSMVMTKHDWTRVKAQTNFEARKLTAYLTRK